MSSEPFSGLKGAGLCAWIPENASDGLPGELLHNFIHIRILNKLQAGFPADPDIEEGTGSGIVPELFLIYLENYGFLYRCSNITISKIHRKAVKYAEY